MKICCSALILPEWMSRNVHSSGWIQVWASVNDSEQHHKVFKIQRQGIEMEGEGDIQEEWQESHLHHKSIQESTLQHWCFKHETQMSYLTEGVKRSEERNGKN